MMTYDPLGSHRREMGELMSHLENGLQVSRQLISEAQSIREEFKDLRQKLAREKVHHATT